MKPILIACFSLVAFVSKAQFQFPASKFKFNNEHLNRGSSQSKPFSWDPYQQRAALISANRLGKIYALPKDKMPCLVPDINQIATMPNARKYFDNSLMLNPYKKEEIIPQQ